ncbi:HNH endonuclease signature motif containing protein [Ruania albidiflava]|uniref:HNH endonuclease signature motif containing protein n=1 Tax=Ruania albidiflava TaxID=366586 RepID=UPI0003B660AA|nr:HNH endonuclease signature motif containing protein [Ruania albidiflava]
MAQESEHQGSPGGETAPEQTVVCPPDLPVLNVCAPVADPVALIDLGAIAHTAGERALAELISTSHAAPVGTQLARSSVDPQLYTLLTQLDLDEADDEDLVEAAAAAERLEAAAHAIKLRAAAALSHRLVMNPAALAHTEATQQDVAADELAVRMRITHRAGTDLVRRGRALDGVLLDTGEALASGVIDASRARVIVDGLDHVPPEVAATVEERVLPRAPRRTVAQLRSDVAKALVAVDADAAAERAHRRATERRVSRPRALPDGMAAMRIEGPAADVLALDVALHAAARATKASGDERTMDQLRFDSLAGIAHRALATGRLVAREQGQDADLPLASQGGHRPTIMVTVPLDQLLPGWTPATGVVPAQNRPGSENGDQGVRAGQCVRADEGDRADQGTMAGLDTSTGQVPSWPPPLPGKHLSPDQVPVLEGYGHITPTLARALAAGGDWYRIVTDPLSGAVLDVGHTRYRPTQAMVDHIRARDGTCARPGCGHRAIECQLDHTREWNHTHPTRGGPTSVDNLAPLCGRDHQVKTHGDFRLTQTGPGVFEWTTPTGHRYRREPDGTTTMLSHPDHLAHYDTSTVEDADDQPDWGPPPF